MPVVFSLLMPYMHLELGFVFKLWASQPRPEYPGHAIFKEISTKKLGRSGLPSTMNATKAPYLQAEFNGFVGQIEPLGHRLPTLVTVQIRWLCELDSARGLDVVNP